MTYPEISYEEEQAILLGAGLRCCDVGGCDKPANTAESDTDGAQLFVCEEHREPDRDYCSACGGYIGAEPRDGRCSCPMSL
jgi:hypothetical protein